MSTVDVNNVIVTGENSVIRLNNNDNDAFTTQASFWRILTCPAGPGDVLYLKSELTEDRWRIYSDNIAMARWLHRGGRDQCRASRPRNPGCRRSVQQIR
jgi:hypothetical protein